MIERDIVEDVVKEMDIDGDRDRGWGEGNLRQIFWLVLPPPPPEHPQHVILSQSNICLTARTLCRHGAPVVQHL